MLAVLIGLTNSPTTAAITGVRVGTGRLLPSTVTARTLTHHGEGAATDGPTAGNGSPHRCGTDWVRSAATPSKEHRALHSVHGNGEQRSVPTGQQGQVRSGGIQIKEQDAPDLPASQRASASVQCGNAETRRRIVIV